MILLHFKNAQMNGVIRILDCIKDIKRYLKQETDEKSNPVMCILGELSIVEKCLVPLLLSTSTTPKVVSAVCILDFYRSEFNITYTFY